MSDEKVVILEFKYLQNKKWYKKTVKSTTVKKDYNADCCQFTQITDKNLQSPFKNWQFSTFNKFSLHL